MENTRSSSFLSLDRFGFFGLPGFFIREWGELPLKYFPPWMRIVYALCLTNESRNERIWPVEISKAVAHSEQWDHQNIPFPFREGDSTKGDGVAEMPCEYTELHAFLGYGTPSFRACLGSQFGQYDLVGEKVSNEFPQRKQLG